MCVLIEQQSKIVQSVNEESIRHGRIIYARVEKIIFAFFPIVALGLGGSFFAVGPWNIVESKVADGDKPWVQFGI